MEHDHGLKTALIASQVSAAIPMLQQVFVVEAMKSGARRRVPCRDHFGLSEPVGLLLSHQDGRQSCATLPGLPRESRRPLGVLLPFLGFREFSPSLSKICDPDGC